MFTEKDKTDNIGKPFADAVEALQKKFPTFTVAAVPMGSMVTMDHRLDRLRVWYDAKTKLVTGVTNG